MDHGDAGDRIGHRERGPNCLTIKNLKRIRCLKLGPPQDETIGLSFVVVAWHSLPCATGLTGQHRATLRKATLPSFKSARARVNDATGR